MAAGAEIFAFGDFELDEARCELRRVGKAVELQATPFRLLQHLIHERERVVSKEELLEAIWPEVVVSDTALSSALKEVRRALGDDGKSQRWIRTLRGHGVRFVGDVKAQATQSRIETLAPAPPIRRAESSVTTILFADLVASTTRLQAAGDEPARELFGAIHERMTKVVEAHAGEELQWLGDGMMAAFGSTADAVRCAVALQRVSRQGVGGQRLSLRIGLNVGELLRQASGSGYFGTPVVVASRLCDRAEAGQILATAVVAGLLAGRRAFRFRDLGAAELKGVDAPVSICEVVHEADDVAPLAAGTPFVGRANELARLERSLDRAQAGEGAVLFVTGEAGIGKTRLVAELAGQARARGARVLSGRCFEGEGARAYGPFAEALDAYADEADSSELLRDLGPYGAQLGELAPRLRARIPDLPELPRLGGEEERTRLFYAFSELLLATARRAPLVLVLDDLHWADGATVALLRYLARFAVKGRLVIVGTYRDTEVGREHPLALALAAMKREVEYERVALGGLDPASVGHLLEALAEHEVNPGFVELMAAETAGNPFFLRELLVHLVEEGKLRREAGTWTSDLPLGEMGIPEGVRQVIGRRLARLSPDANRLLSSAAGLQGSFSFEVARRVVDLGEGEALDALDEALDAQLVRPGDDGDTYEFTHDLIRATLYAVLNPSRRARLHRRIAEEMERAWGEAAGERAGEIARQYHESRSLPGAERGAVHALAAADFAEKRAAHEEVARSVRMALELLPAGDARRPRLVARRAIALAQSLEGEEGARLGSEAAELVAASEGDEAAATYLVELCHSLSYYARLLAWSLAAQGLRYVGDRRDRTWAYFANMDQSARDAADPASLGIPLDLPVRQEITRAVLAAGFEGLNPPGVLEDNIALTSRREALAHDRPTIQLQYAGELVGTQARYLELAQQALGRGEVAHAGYLFCLLSRICVALGELDAAKRRIEQASGLAARLGQESVVYLNLLAAAADLAFTTGEGYERLLALGEKMVEQRAPEQAFGRANACSYMACGYAHVGNERRALEFLALVLPAVARAPGWAVNYTRIVHLASETLWVLERPDHCRTVEPNLREKTFAPDFRYPSSDARLSLARLCALQGRFDEAIDWFAKAREVLDEQGARPLRAITDYDEALMYARRGGPGDRERAGPLLERALAQFREIGMPGWERRALGLLG